MTKFYILISFKKLISSLFSITGSPSAMFQSIIDSNCQLKQIVKKTKRFSNISKSKFKPKES